MSSLTLNWDASTDNNEVKSYEVYQNDIKVATVNSLEHDLTGLEANTSYSFFIKAIDYDGNISEKSNTINVVTRLSSSLDYCESKGSKTSYEWIDFVSFGGITNSTGENNGYANFTDKIATVVLGSTNDLVVSAGFSGNSYIEYFSVWIDYNQNGNFEDNERVVNESVANADNNTHAITIPNNALLGSTRMRVSMKYEQTQTPCESFNYGEVEDYTVNITNAFARKGLNANNNTLVGLQIHPNPSSKTLNIKIEKTLKNAQYQIIDISGKIIDQNSFSPLINIENLKTGMYFIKIFNQDTTYSKSFIKSRK